MKEGDSYCGFLCADVRERQQAIINDLKDFAEYNPEVAWDVLMALEDMISNGYRDVEKIRIAQQEQKKSIVQ